VFTAANNCLPTAEQHGKRDDDRDRAIVREHRQHADPPWREHDRRVEQVLGVHPPGGPDRVDQRLRVVRVLASAAAQPPDQRPRQRK
jgi:hypothetical protein